MNRRSCRRSSSRCAARAATLLRALAVVALCHAGQLQAAELASALAALERGDYPAAIAQLDELTAQGDAVAATRLAALYQKGLGVPKDATRAAMLYEQAAARGNPDAQYHLGNMYLLGEGVPQDDDWAFTYYREAAKQGHAMAQKNVAEFYRAAGLTPPPEEVSAASPPQSTRAAPSQPQAAPADAPPSVELVADEQPGQEAAMSAANAAAVAAPPAQFSQDELNAMQIARSHGIRIADSGSLPPALPPVRVPRGGSAPTPPPPDTDLSPRATANELPAAKALLADGKPAEARPMLEAAAHDGSAEAQYLLAQLLVTLSNGAEDNASALAWLQRAAAGGYADAQYLLGARYERGEGVMPDEAEAVTWYRAAARQGHPDAAARLRAIYRDAGLPLPEDVAPAGNRQGALARMPGFSRGDPHARYVFRHDSTQQCIPHACSLQAG